MTDERCDCGQPLHYLSDDMQRVVQSIISKRGPTVLVKVEGTRRCYKVPRHYVALHGLKAVDLDDLAQRYNWEPSQ